MGNIKRVRDSKKRTVRQGKEQVWLVDWEKVVNTNHWFKEATWTDVVYDSSWESPQEPLQVYDNGREEVGWWTTSATIIWISQQYLEIVNGESTWIEVYFSPDDADISNISAISTNPEIVGVVNVGQDPWVLYFQISAGADSGYETVTFSDWTNSYNCEVACTPFIHVESIGYPSRNEIYVSSWNDQSFTFNYSPERASNPFVDIIIEGQNANYGFTTSNWVCRVKTYYRGEDVDGTISYHLTTAPETVYNVTVHNVTPTIRVESLSWIPSTVSQLAPDTWRTFEITYSPEDADHIEAQVQIEIADPNVVWVGIRSVNTSNHTFLVDYFWKSEGSSEVSFYLNGNLVGSSIVTIEYPAISALSNLQYTNPTADWWEVYSRMSAWATFEYTPTNWSWWLTITQTGWTRVDWTSWDTPGWQDISISVEEINYNNGTATVYFFVDSEASVWQRGSWRIAVENDPNEYLDVKITYANMPEWE